MPENTDLPGISLSPTAEAVLTNFEQLLGMADTVLDKLGHPHPSKCTKGVDVGSLSKAADPTSTYGNVVRSNTASTVPTGSAWGKSSNIEFGEGSSVQELPLRSNVQLLHGLPHPTFDAAHAICVQEDVVNAVEVETQTDRKKKGFSRNTFVDLVDSRQTSRNATYRAVEEVFPAASESSLLDSSDRTWQAGTEISPSSCEYMSHVETASEGTEVDSEELEKWKKTSSRSPSPVERTGQLRSGRTRRKSVELKGKVEHTTKSEGRKYRSSLNRRGGNIDEIAKWSKDIESPPAVMGKDKETFETWSKQGRGSKVATEVQKSPAGTRRLSKTQQSAEKDNLKKPRGMKRTHLQEGGETEFNDVELEFLDGNEERLGRKQQVPGSAAEKGTEGVSGRSTVQAERVNNVVDNIPTHRPGKERARTPVSDDADGFMSPAFSDHFISKHLRRSNTKRHDSTDSEVERQGEPSRVRDRRHRRRRRRSVDSEGSSDFESPSVEGKGKRSALTESVHRQRGRYAPSSPRRSRRAKEVANETSEEDSDRQSDGGRRHAKKRRNRNLSPEFQRHRKNERDYSHDEEEADNSSDEDRYREPDVEVKAEKAKADSPRGETRKRQERRKRQSERESERHNRERQGLKGHYISVNHMGIPYGFGVAAWRLELSKLCQALDPSVTNIRHQPEEKMATLRRRLKDTFEYSAPVDRAYIRKLAGKVVTQRRSRMLSAMKDGDECPSGLNRDIWRRLDRMRQDPNREELSQRMKYANAARVNKGRTGPKGEDGTREDLQRKLGREPDPGELQLEMRRKKGYSGVSKKRKSTMLSPSAAVYDGEDGAGDTDLTQPVEEVKHSRPAVEDGGRSVQYEVHLLQKMSKELEALRAEMRAVKKAAIHEAVDNGGPSTSVRIAGPESNATAQPGTELTGTAAHEGMQKGADEVPEFRASPPKKKLRSSKKHL